MSTVLMQDVQLVNKDQTRWIFLSAVAVKKRAIVFVFEEVEWDAATEDNVPVSCGRVPHEKFSKWFNNLTKKGWTICR